MATAYIVTSDTLLAVGIKHILNESFNITSHIVTTSEALKGLQAPEEADYIITDEAAFVANAAFFSINKSRTIVATASVTDIQSEPRLLCRYTKECDLIENLEEIFSFSTKQNANQKQNKLSAREIEVLRLVVSGHINKEIADNLNISINTVLTHRKNITAKLGIKSVSGLSIYAMMNGLVAPSPPK